jgi:hypothetical protein
VLSQTWTNFTDGCLNVADQVPFYTWTDLIKPVIATAQGGGNKGCNPPLHQSLH